MAKRNVTPALADITQDIAGEIPLSLINNWLYSDRSKKTYEKLTQPYKVKGIIASTDSSGLSRLSQSKSLFEVIKLISYPKQLVFNFGSTIGGTPIGVWAADNTQMFYPDSIEAEQIIYQMSHVFKLLQNNDLKIGLAMHKGEFIHLGGGMYGDDADYVEDLAETYSAGGQILITSSILNAIDDSLKSKAKLKEGGRESFDFDYSDIEKFTQSNIDKYYPIPYSNQFYQELDNTDLGDAKKLSELENKHLQNKIVILVRVFHKEQGFLLDQLVEWVEANALIERTRSKYNIFKIKSNGNLGIFLSDDAKEALEFSKELKIDFSKSKYIFNVGICRGQVLICDISDDNFDIAGEPVNVASKIAEDAKERNKILVEESVKASEGKPFKFEISHIEIKGLEI